MAAHEATRRPTRYRSRMMSRPRWPMEDWTVTTHHPVSSYAKRRRRRSGLAACGPRAYPVALGKLVWLPASGVATPRRSESPPRPGACSLWRSCSASDESLQTAHRSLQAIRLAGSNVRSPMRRGKLDEPGRVSRSDLPAASRPRHHVFPDIPAARGSGQVDHRRLGIAQELRIGRKPAARHAKEARKALRKLAKKG